MSNNNRKASDEQSLAENQMPSLDEKPSLPPQVPAPLPDADEPKDQKEFEKTVQESGFSSPHLLVSDYKTVALKEKARVMEKIEGLLKNGKDVYVIATKGDGDYPPRVRRSKDEKFKIKKAEHFSFNWMKLVE